MNMIPAESSNLAAVGYERGTLYIRFRNGRLYAYFGVPETIYRGLMAADSHGKYFHAHIRDVYGYQEIG